MGKGVFVAPSYDPIDPTRYGSDVNWRTVKVQEGDWQSLCVAYVNTDGGNCDEWCDNLGLQCVRAMDDAHHQREELSDWLVEEGSVPTNCTLYEGGGEGCEKRYDTQICACETTTTTTMEAPGYQRTYTITEEPAGCVAFESAN